ncbi:uncharacterized protein LOC115990899 [Quercus lobata]|uniref:uncharacterized protein LOC115990899 n=1 Tax=Quercus lobata TaxID=97700 RepID=UPI001248EBC5|nr:uncharacterized protein LOC115990899 [Quercus lobata]
MNVKIISWNVRGLNEQDKRLWVRNLIRSWRPDIVCLQETKMELITRVVIRSLWGGQHVDWSYLGSCGASRGVLLMWDTRVVDKVEEAVGHFSVSSGDRRFLWEELSGLSSWWNVPWCVGGDFNVVRFPSERAGATAFTAAMREFSEFISEQGLIDIPLEGGTFTWSNSREVASKARLDRFLFSQDWEDKFPTVCQRRMSRLLSDHFPIVLEGGSFHRGRRPFRFENMWLKDEGFVERVRSWWESYHLQGAPSFVLANKLKLLKHDLKKWNVEVFGNVEERGKQLWKDLSVLETIEDSRGLTEEEKLELERIRGELEKASLLEEICWRQKSRVLCIREGDRNTKFFHRVANSHRRFNSIDRLTVDGELSSDPEAIAECISRF